MEGSIPNTTLAILGASVALVVVPVVAGLCWCIKYLLQEFVPDRDRDCHKEKEELREIYEKQIQEDRDLFREEFRKITTSIMDLALALRTNQQALETLIRGLESK